jgi:acetolactate synthase-1/2/3 large subunit
LPIVKSFNMTVAEYIADQLYKNGVRHIFGVPGGPSIPYMESFRSAGIGFILTAHEAAAGVMAGVTARLTGIPGVCHATFGPGAVNLASGAGGALLDRTPLIILTSELDDKMIHRTTQMNINHQKLYEPLTKATFRMTPGNAAEVIGKALKICREEYPGPVHIGLPSDIAGYEVEPANDFTAIDNCLDFSNDTDRIISLLEKSRKPLIAAGLTSARYAIGSKLAGFLDKNKIPVVLTPMAKGLLPENHPCYAGVLFHALSDYLEDIFRETDLVIGLGYDPVEYNYESWMPDVPLIIFNTIETDLPEIASVTRFTGHPDEWFTILSRMENGSIVFNRSAVQSVRDETFSVFKGFTDHFGPVTAFKIMQEELPKDTILTVDVGSHLHLAGQYWNTSGKQNIIMTNGWSGMGFGLPAALGAKIANPGSTVVCVTGDGGFLMTAGEIITARRYNLQVITVVFSDGELNLIKLKQSWQNLSPYGTSLYSGDLFDSESFFGISVINADSEDSMRIAIKEAVSLKKPVIINTRIDPDDYKWLIVRKES